MDNEDDPQLTPRPEKEVPRHSRIHSDDKARGYKKQNASQQVSERGRSIDHSVQAHNTTKRNSSKSADTQKSYSRDSEEPSAAFKQVKDSVALSHYSGLQSRTEVGRNDEEEQNLELIYETENKFKENGAKRHVLVKPPVTSGVKHVGVAHSPDPYPEADLAQSAFSRKATAYHPKTADMQKKLREVESEILDNGTSDPESAPKPAHTCQSKMAVPTESKIEFHKKRCRKSKSKESKVDVIRPAPSGTSIRITVSQQQLAPNLSGVTAGQSFLARINILEPLGNDLTQTMTPETVEQYLNANPDFLARYIAGNVDVSTLQGWLNAMTQDQNFNCFDENANGGLQASASYCDPCGYTPGMPLKPSGIDAKPCRRRKVKTKCNLSTLMNYYRQGQQVIDWSMNHGISHYGTGPKCGVCGQPGGICAPPPLNPQPHYHCSSVKCKCNQGNGRGPKPVQQSSSVTNQRKINGQSHGSTSRHQSKLQMNNSLHKLQNGSQK